MMSEAFVTEEFLDDEVSDLRPPAFTDDALAIAFAGQYADSLRYVAALGKWLIYNGTHWRFDETLITREIPRLCRGGSKSLTVPAVAPQAPTDETLNASRKAHERIWSMTCEAPEPTIADAEYHEGVIRRGIVNLRCTRGKTGLTGVEGRLQAAHLSGPPSDPDAALSGSYLKAPGSAGGYLLARQQARMICRTASAQCDDKKIAKLIASAKTVRAVEHLAQADRRIAATVEQWDADPWLLNTPAGVVDLPTGKMRPQRPEDYLTKITSVAPDRSCATPTWKAFLERVGARDAELIEFLQRVCGYALTGLTIEHALFFLHGHGANGKTTFLNAITEAAGNYHRAAPIETFTATNHDRHPTDLAGLRGARIVTATETEEGRRWAESKIKALTGGDKISARFMRQDFFEYTPAFKLIIAGNHKPGLRSVDEAIRRRFNLIPFAVTIPQHERDEMLPDKLRAELPGILAWMIDGTAEWRKKGLAPPAIVTEATAAYLEAEDAIAAWVEDQCIQDPAVFETSTALFGSWSNWAEANGEYVGSLKRFVAGLEARGYTPMRKGYGRGFIGLRVKPAC
jgi:putative DNA primase/helicase